MGRTWSKYIMYMYENVIANPIILYNNKNKVFKFKQKDHPYSMISPILGTN
jgi:hypothetical protein